MSRRVKLIFNPHAQRGRAWELGSVLQSVVERHAGAEWAATEYPTQATALAEQAGRDGFDIVAALGGDGTVHEVVNGLMRLPAKRRPMLASVPIGSGNDFSASAGVAQNAEVAMERVFSGTPKPVDLGLAIDGSGRREYFSNALGIGFDAKVTFYSYHITRLQGFSMYLWAVIQTIVRSHDAPRMTLTIDDERFEQEVLMLTLCNGRREGGGFLVAPEALPDDGVLDFAMVEKVSRLMMFRLIPEVMKGTHGRFRQVRLGRFRNLELKSDRPLTIHMDGELYSGLTSDVFELRAEVCPEALQVIV
ncbi:MAG: diacylglycerol kinase family protein [Chloroflexota bacterium]